MLTEEKNEVLEEETLDGSEQIDEIDDTDEEVYGEEEESAEEESEPKDKTDEMSLEELKKSYKNLESLAGRLGQEVGELRKRVAPVEEKKQYNVNDIPSMPDNVLDNFVQQYEDYLSKPGVNIEDSDKYPAMVVQYQKLIAEKATRGSLNAAKSSVVAADNEKEVSKYKSKSGITDAEAEAVKKFALKISDNGRITESDLEVALHKLYPDQYRKMLFDKDKQRLAKAQTKTPLIPAGGGQTKQTGLSIEALEALDPDDYGRYVNSLSDADFAKLQKIMNKR